MCARVYWIFPVLEMAALLFLVAAVPSGPPRDVNARTSSSKSILVTWSDVPVDQRNGTLQSYQILYEQYTFSELPQSLSVVVEAALPDETLLDNLEEYVQYTIRIRASNEEGYGPYSSPINATTYQDVPSVTPGNVTLSSRLPHQLHLSWTRPPDIDINGELLPYSLRYHRVGLNDFIFERVDAGLENVVLTGLYSYTMYEVFIAASTVNGTGPMAKQTALTVETAPQASPQNFTVNSSTPYAIDLEWIPPEESEWNGILRGYRIRYAQNSLSLFSSESNWFEIDISNPNQTNYTIDGLDSSTEYCIQIAAFTVEPGPYTSPLCTITLSSPDDYTTPSSSTINTHTTTTTVLLNGTTISTGDGRVSVVIVTGSVVSGVILMVGMVFAICLMVIVKKKRNKKSLNLANYFTPVADDTLQLQQSMEEGEEEERESERTWNNQQEPAGLSFSNPMAETFDLQQNYSYHHQLPLRPLPPQPPNPNNTPNDGETLSSVRIAENPRYREFSFDQLNPSTRGVGAEMGGVVGGVVSLETSGEYSYPATFRAIVRDGDPYSRVRMTSDPPHDPDYATVT